MFAVAFFYFCALAVCGSSAVSLAEFEGDPITYGEEYVQNLHYLKECAISLNLGEVLRLSINMAQFADNSLFPPFVCRNPTIFSEYVDYESAELWIERKNISEGIPWSYRLALYNTQLQLLRAVGKRSLQLKIMGTSTQDIPKCLNPLTSWNLERHLSNKDFSTINIDNIRSFVSDVIVKNIDYHINTGIKPRLWKLKAWKVVTPFIKAGLTVKACFAHLLINLVQTTVLAYETHSYQIKV
jgi:hypothetical protein